MRRQVVMGHGYWTVQKQPVALPGLAMAPSCSMTGAIGGLSTSVCGPSETARPPTRKLQQRVDEPTATPR